MPVSTSRRVPKFRPDEPDLARARGITPVGLAHDLILADGADRRIARPLVSKCSIGGNFRAPCDGGVSVQVSVIPRAREVRFVRLASARLHMKGKTVFITGGTSGICEIASIALAQMGARIVLVARNKSRAEATLARLRRRGTAAHCVYFADLTRLAEMKRVAAEIANGEPTIDILINNAGALFGTRRL